MFNEFNLFNFGNDDSDVILLYKKDGELKYKRCPRSFLKKVDDTYYLKREIRKLKMYASIKNTITRDQLVKILEAENGRPLWRHLGLSEQELEKSKIISNIWKRISKLCDG